MRLLLQTTAARMMLLVATRRRIAGPPSLPHFPSIETAMREARNRIDRVVAL